MAKTYWQIAAGSAGRKYANLLKEKPRDRYPLDPKNVDGALGVLKWLLPMTLTGTDERHQRSR